MSKIVIDARELRTSTGRYIERLLHYLQQIDTDNSYTVLLKPKDFDTWEPVNRKFHKLACPYKEFSFNEQLGFLIQLHELKPDLVHFGMVQQPILYTRKVVTTIHDLTTAKFGNPSKNKIVFTIKQIVYRVVIKVAAAKSKMIITPSEYVKDDLAKFAKVNSRKIVVTYESSDEIEGEPETIDGLDHRKYIMYVGRPNPHKNLYRLVRAYAELKKTNPELCLVLVGKEDSLFKKMAKWVEDKSIEDVVFTGFVSDNQLKWLYQNTVCYVFPSLSEGFGLPGLEAMRHGAPVISSNATCLPEIYGDAALYFDPHDTEDMAQKIDSIINNKQRANNYITKGYEQVKKYSWKKMAQETLDVYNSVLNK
ncbi:MAG TPA: glycosyltransferase family 1 protein [Candidatus Saccharimonadales bacterium]